MDGSISLVTALPRGPVRIVQESTLVSNVKYTCANHCVTFSLVCMHNPVIFKGNYKIISCVE